MANDILNYDPFQIARRLLSGQSLAEMNWPRRITRRDDLSTEETTHWLPVCDIKETSESFVLSMEVPGVDPSYITTEIDENKVLTIQGERKVEHQEEGSDYNLRERISGSFKRQFLLPDNADAEPEKIKAQSRHGVLVLTIPKKAKAQPRKIVIHSEEA